MSSTTETQLIISDVPLTPDQARILFDAKITYVEDGIKKELNFNRISNPNSLTGENVYIRPYVSSSTKANVFAERNTVTPCTED